MSGADLRGAAAGYGRAAAGFTSALVRDLAGGAKNGLVAGGRFVENWLLGSKHALYGLAVTRILLALTGMGLLISNYSTRLYTFGSGSAWNGEAAQPLSDFPQIWIFSLFHRLALNDLAFTLAYLSLFGLAVLLLLGWRTKIVLPVYFVMWVSFIEMNASVGDQGDNMYRIVLMSLLFADTAARWSFDAGRRADSSTHTGSWLQRKWRGEALMPLWLTNLFHNLVLVVVTCHVSFVYASGALYKASGAPWQQGYAIYNPLQTQRFGTWPELSDLLGTWAPAVAAVSWASIILQMFFPMMLLQRFTRVIALVGIGGFHVGIAVLMGLPWFSLAMIAIDAIFIRDVTWRAMANRVRTGWDAARGQERARGAPDETVDDEVSHADAAPVRTNA
ncbi:HTTM domain-containing protein [Georgenia halophila]|uniref:HTTM domain-containing protein n=1 Tax=Georgenia halophila TaxID=620889 RepID=A0ABP8LPY6_9MICO